MKVLVLARHAKAEVASAGQSDHSRVLEQRGQRDARALGAALVAAGFEPDVVYVSDAARTIETWEGVGAAWETDDVRAIGELYATTVGTVVAVVRGTPAGASSVIVVGHEPTMSSAAALLAGPGSSRIALARLSGGLRTGAAAVLEFDGEWAELGKGAARLRAVVGRDD